MQNFLQVYIIKNGPFDWAENKRNCRLNNKKWKKKDNWIYAIDK